MQTLDALLRGAVLRLREAGLATPALDARLLLQQATGLGAAELIANSAQETDARQAREFEALVVRRLAHEPVSRILGWREFYGRRFAISPDVLDPRPDTESLVELCLSLLPEGRPLRILDLGTGSGILALTLLAERPLATAVAVDVSPAALAVARRNAQELGVDTRCQFHAGSWLAGVGGVFDLIVSNPPYIPLQEVQDLAADVRLYDPHLALAGGTDGLDPYRTIAAGAARHIASGGNLAFEIGAGQAHDVTGICLAQGWRPGSQMMDLAQHVRALSFCRAAA